MSLCTSQCVVLYCIAMLSDFICQHLCHFDIGWFYLFQDLRQGEVVKSWKGHSGKVYTMQLSQDRQSCYTMDSDNTVSCDDGACLVLVVIRCQLRTSFHGVRYICLYLSHKQS